MKRDILDHGFVELIEHMGSDQRIVDAARVSIAGDQVKPSSTNRHLIRYLLRHRHCYHPEMEVLTTRGWIRWDHCNAVEEFLVPDPVTRSLKPEVLALEVFDAEETMESFSNGRMSYCVTPDHRMWFRPKREDNYTIVRARDMPHWGHFDPLKDYTRYAFEGEASAPHKLLGFYLGDGSYSSSNRISFHLKKNRKKEYLEALLNDLDIPYTKKASTTYEDAHTYLVEIPEWFKVLFHEADIAARSTSKALSFSVVCSFTDTEKRGLLQGLLNSDGHYNDSRLRWEYSSSSKSLLDLVQLLFAECGIDAHYSGTNSIYAYVSSRTSLEARNQYFSTSFYRGKVYCTTTSTGLLMVRGNSNSFAFVCGNTTPFETVRFTFAVKAPIFVVRQWMRHRMGTFNEMSARYGVLPEEFYVPDLSRMNVQAKDNHQGSGADTVSDPAYVAALIRNQSKIAFETYHELLNTGLSRELARSVLPVNTYTQYYWTVDLWNLMHFLRLRLDGHAQYEIRVYGEAILDLIRAHVPLAVEAFEDYILDAKKFSGKELSILSVDEHFTDDILEQKLGSKREVQEFKDKLGV